MGVYPLRFEEDEERAKELLEQAPNAGHDHAKIDIQDWFGAPINTLDSIGPTEI